MAEAKGFLEGVAALLWPLIAIVTLYLFRPAIAALIESARGASLLSGYLVKSFQWSRHSVKWNREFAFSKC